MFTSQQSAMALFRCLVAESLETPLKAWCHHVLSLTDLDDDTKISWILSWVLRPEDYANPSVFSSDYQLVSFFKKASFSDNIRDVERDAAYQKFRLSEARCASVNEAFSPGFKCNQWFGTLLFRARKTIAYALGDVHDCLGYLESNSERHTSCSVRNEVDCFGKGYRYPYYVDPQGRLGPGVNVAPVREGCPPHSMSGWERILTPTASPDFLFARKMDQLGYRDQHVVTGDVLTFVPKNRKEARSICYGPSLNVMIQLLIGSYMKNRLKSTLRVDLHCQKRNQSLARLGSLCNSYATIDLSAASDSIATMLVFELLPLDWFHLLDGCRSKSYFDPVTGLWTPYAKFSAMGNGFTFELESLIFYAVAEAAAYLSRGVRLAKEEISIFGDDIIVPKDVALDVMNALVRCGFVINREKTYTTGPFRESCGGDYFHGHLVTPIKIKEFTDENIKQQWVQLYSELYYRTRSVPFHRAALPRMPRALGFIKSRVFEHFPGIAIFREEWKGDEPEPTNRWLPGPSTDYCNIYFDRHLQDFFPRRIARFREDVLVVYDLHTDLCGHAWGLSGRLAVPTLSESSFRLCRYRPGDLTPVRRSGRRAASNGVLTQTS